MILVEIQGRPHYFNHPKGTLRLGAFERLKISDSQITPDIEEEIKLGWVVSVPDEVEIEPPVLKKKGEKN